MDSPKVHNMTTFPLEHGMGVIQLVEATPQHTDYRRMALYLDRTMCDAIARDHGLTIADGEVNTDDPKAFRQVMMNMSHEDLDMIASKLIDMRFGRFTFHQQMALIALFTATKVSYTVGFDTITIR